MSEHVLQNNKPGLPWPTAIRESVDAAASIILTPSRAPWTISVSPASGGSYLVEVTASPPSTAAGDVVWHNLDTSKSEKKIFFNTAPVSAVRVTATAAAAVVDLVS